MPGDRYQGPGFIEDSKPPKVKMPLWLKILILANVILFGLMVNQYRIMYNAYLGYSSMRDGLVGYKKAVDETHEKYAESKADFIIQCMATSKDKTPSEFCMKLGDRVFPDMGPPGKS